MTSARRPGVKRVRAAPARRAANAIGPRARRGAPEDTRARLVAAAAEQFEVSGYHGTDSNRIARAAGYAPGTFYKHFADKTEAFLAVYEQWIARQWDKLALIASDHIDQRTKAERMANLVVAHHRAWPGLRSSLRELVAISPAVRQAHRESRRRQMTLMAQLGLDDASRSALLVLQVERIADAIADGELRELGIPDKEALGWLISLIEKRLQPG